MKISWMVLFSFLFCNDLFAANSGATKDSAAGGTAVIDDQYVDELKIQQRNEQRAHKSKQQQKQEQNIKEQGRGSGKAQGATDSNQPVWPQEIQKQGE